MSTCIQDSSYYIDGVTDIDGGLADLPSQRRCCDVLAVEGGKTADTLALLTKHLASIGSPTWRCEPEGKRHLEAFLSVSDRGSDQALLRLTVPYDITSKNVVALSVDCFDHASHCTERTALGLIDIKLRKMDKQWSYYSSSVKLGHVWRGFHAKAYVYILANHHVLAPLAKYLCSVCDAGRWGAVHEFERKTLSVGIPVLHETLVTIISNKHTTHRQSPIMV